MMKDAAEPSKQKLDSTDSSASRRPLQDGWLCFLDRKLEAEWQEWHTVTQNNDVEAVYTFLSIVSNLFALLSWRKLSAHHWTAFGLTMSINCLGFYLLCWRPQAFRRKRTLLNVTKRLVIPHTVLLVMNKLVLPATDSVSVAYLMLGCSGLSAALVNFVCTPVPFAWAYYVELYSCLLHFAFTTRHLCASALSTPYGGRLFLGLHAKLLAAFPSLASAAPVREAPLEAVCMAAVNAYQLLVVTWVPVFIAYMWELNGRRRFLKLRHAKLLPRYSSAASASQGGRMGGCQRSRRVAPVLACPVLEQPSDGRL
jgi:hypothetical protein